MTHATGTGPMGSSASGLLAAGPCACLRSRFAIVAFWLIPHDKMYGPQAALIAGAFAPEVRYTGILARLPVASSVLVE